MGSHCSQLATRAPPCDPAYFYSPNHDTSTRTRGFPNSSGNNPKESRRIRVRAVTIGALPDSVLLEIFDFCRMDFYGLPIFPVWGWNKLIHVCRRWRCIIFASPRRLNLELLCTHGTPVKKNLGYWPTYPIIIDYFIYSYYGSKGAAPHDEGDVIAAIEHPDRVRRVEIVVTSSLLGKMATVMQEPFTELTRLRLSSNQKDGDMPVLPGSFLGGSAPRLRDICLDGIPFPALPTLLLSAGDLVTLKLDKIPQTGYISPEAMVTGLTALTRLKTLSIRFQSPTSRPDQRHPAPLTRVVLAALTFEFYGVCEYLEELVTRIDAPELTSFEITYFNQLIFQVPQLSQFIGRAGNLQAALFESADVGFGGNSVNFRLNCSREQPHKSYLLLHISCQALDWQVSSMTQVISQCSTVLSSVRQLSIDGVALQRGWRDDTDHHEWLELFRQFIAVETLRVCRRLAGHVSLALEDITEAMVAEVLPCLYSLYLEGQSVTTVERFTTMRLHSNRTVTLRR